MHLLHFFYRGAREVATWNVADAADHLPLALPFGAGIVLRLLPGATGGSAPPRGRRRPAEMRLLLFQARLPPDRPQCDCGRCRLRSGNNQSRRSRFHMRRRRPFHLHRPRRLCGGELCRWWRLLGCGGHRRRDRYTGGERSWNRCTRWVVAGDDGCLCVGCSSQRWTKKRPE